MIENTTLSSEDTYDDRKKLHKTLGHIYALCDFKLKHHPETDSKQLLETIQKCCLKQLEGRND